eukprot:6175834-Pleurochrysis_carterae.AAC.1
MYHYRNLSSAKWSRCLCLAHRLQAARAESLVCAVAAAAVSFAGLAAGGAGAVAAAASAAVHSQASCAGELIVKGDDSSSSGLCGRAAVRADLAGAVLAGAVLAGAAGLAGSVASFTTLLPWSANTALSTSMCSLFRLGDFIDDDCFRRSRRNGSRAREPPPPNPLMSFRSPAP